MDKALLTGLVIIGLLIFLNETSSVRTCVEFGIAQGIQPQMVCKTQSALARWLVEMMPARP